MTPPTPVILGYSEAAMFLRGPAVPDVSAILSIHGSREFGVDATAPHRLDLAFDDVEIPPTDDPTAALRAWTRRRWAQQNGLTEIPPTAADAAAIIRFAQEIRDANGLLLCHCGAGISRAPAAALICLATWRGPGTEAECVREVRTTRPAALSHTGLVRLADDLLGREGRLVRAIADAR
jgi:predicted protein tyrosine phosphatase